MQKVLEVEDLHTYFFTRRGVVKAVNGVNFSVNEKETLGIVGESGCGKSITCLSIIRLVPAPAGKIIRGRILLNGEDLLLKSEREMREIRGKEMSMILQDPMTSLNPVFTIGQQVSDPIRFHQRVEKSVLREKVIDILAKVKIPSPDIRMKEYPHQMSGGMRQRIVGAMSLGCQPNLLIADEPTTALDVTIQAQFLNLLNEIQETFGLAMIIVTHDFGIVAKICDKVVVMYAGKVMESARIRELFNNPIHPYTRALLESLPKMERRVERLYSIEGQPPDLMNLSEGCSFAKRCPYVKEICEKEFPSETMAGNEHTVKCWLSKE